MVVNALSHVIAIVLILMVVILLYPIAVFFWVIGSLGKVIGVVSDWIFERANNAIKHLWSDLKSAQ